MQIRLPDAAATEALGRRLAALLPAACAAGPLMIHLAGPLGAGKTTLARGLLRGLGHTGRVRSPTFTLLEPYEFPGLFVTHLDLYRIADPAGLEDLGLTDLLVPGSVLLVEWPERGGGHLPPADLHLALDYQDPGRGVECAAFSATGRRLLAQLSASDRSVI